MRQLICKEIHPTKITLRQWDEIYSLHQTFFNLDQDFIKANLLKRDVAYLYYRNDTSILVGSAGVQWFETEDSVILYVGSVVVHQEMRAAGISSRIMIKSLKTTIEQFPYKKKYISTFATTASAYSLCKKYFSLWPRLNKKLPLEIKKMVTEIQDLISSEPLNIDDYKITKHLPQKDEEQLYSTRKNQSQHRRYADEFEILNPAFKQGAQLFCIAQIGWKEILMANIAGTFTMIKALKRDLKRESLSIILKVKSATVIPLGITIGLILLGATAAVYD